MLWLLLFEGYDKWKVEECEAQSGGELLRKEDVDRILCCSAYGRHHKLPPGIGGRHHAATV